MADVVVIGGGLAGVECAWQLAERGVRVKLCEQKPLRRSPAHHDEHLAELVCSNSFRAAAPTNAVGLLKEEMRTLGSFVMRVGDATRVPAGGAMAVDRTRFSEAITRSIDEHPRIEREATTVEALPEDGPVVLATGPMTAEALAGDLARIIGQEHLAYYDSIAPIVTADSIAWEHAFHASRYDKGGDDAYVNCPLDAEQYRAFVEALKAADKMQAHAFEKPRYFEGCLPIEVMAERGVDTLAYGPMKPVGLTDPRTGRRPHAVVQLRREDTEGTAYNIVGFQTRMTQPEQRRVFALVPALAQARFERFGSVHRNTFVDAPRVLDEQLRLRARPHVRLAGQITGVEGYVESAACGLCVGLMLASELRGDTLPPPPPTTALGALLGHLRREGDDFQPSNVVWSMFAPLSAPVRSRELRREALGARARTDLRAWRDRTSHAPPNVAQPATGAA